MKCKWFMCLILALLFVFCQACTCKINTSEIVSTVTKSYVKTNGEKVDSTVTKKTKDRFYQWYGTKTLKEIISKAANKSIEYPIY